MFCIDSSKACQPETSAVAWQVPSNEAQRVAMGFQRYHCYFLPILQDLDSYLALDASQGIESAAIMWGCESQLPVALHLPGLHSALCSLSVRREPEQQGVPDEAILPVAHCRAP